MTKDLREAMKHLQKARELAAKTPSPFQGMSLQQAITKMRKVREELWEEKFAASSRHK
ncbi:MAG: hypothetical protein KKB76_02185 [Candidatus Omnitrophica bacterium]|nr:hypothetical protein [Candidatus Omnitrophota bacterium]